MSHPSDTKSQRRKAHIPRDITRPRTSWLPTRPAAISTRACVSHSVAGREKNIVSRTHSRTILTSFTNVCKVNVSINKQKMKIVLIIVLLYFVYGLHEWLTILHYRVFNNELYYYTSVYAWCIVITDHWCFVIIIGWCIFIIISLFPLSQHLNLHESEWGLSVNKCQVRRHWRVTQVRVRQNTQRFRSSEGS